MAKSKAKLLFVLMLLIIAACSSLPQSKPLFVIQDEEVDTFRSHVGTRIINTKIRDNLEVDGQLDIVHSEIKKMVINGNSKINYSLIKEKSNINGSAEITNSSIQAPLQIQGNVKAEDTKFKDELIVFGNVIELTNIQLGQLKIKGQGRPIIKLLKGTLIKGDLIFSQDSAKIYIDKTSGVSGRILQDLPNKPITEIFMGS